LVALLQNRCPVRFSNLSLVKVLLLCSNTSTALPYIVGTGSGNLLGAAIQPTRDSDISTLHRYGAMIHGGASSSKKSELSSSAWVPPRINTKRPAPHHDENDLHTSTQSKPGEPATLHCSSALLCPALPCSALPVPQPVLF
jgi:hypothetical protein